MVFRGAPRHARSCVGRPGNGRDDISEERDHADRRDEHPRQSRAAMPGEQANGSKPAAGEEQPENTDDAPTTMFSAREAVGEKPAASSQDRPSKPHKRPERFVAAIQRPKRARQNSVTPHGVHAARQVQQRRPQRRARRNQHGADNQRAPRGAAEQRPTYVSASSLCSVNPCYVPRCKNAAMQTKSITVVTNKPIIPPRPARRSSPMLLRRPMRRLPTRRSSKCRAPSR